MPEEQKRYTKSFDVKVLDKSADGGRIIISTGIVDRDRDRVMPLGGKIDDYLRNPVVQFAHNYYDAWATVGRTKTIEVNADGLIADFDLRPPANEADPQNIIRLLWEGDWIRAASIGFMPEMGGVSPNDFGGLDFNSWSLLEWSICAIPANQSALRLMAQSYPKALEAYQKRGRVLSAANEAKIKQAHENLGAVLEQITSDEDDGKTADPLAALQKDVASLHSKLDQLLAQREMPVPEPMPEPVDYTDTLTRIRALRAAFNPARS